MTGVRADQRGVTSGMLNLSRNLGLITGASVMGAVFSLAAGDRRHLERAVPTRSPPGCTSRSWSPRC